MSNPTSVLNGATSQGFVSVAENGLRGMITLRGDLSNAKIKAAVKRHLGVVVPDMRKIITKSGKAVAWMSPDELLLLCDYAEATAITSALQKELAKTHSLVVNVSDARAQFTVQGVEVRDCLAKLTPANLTDTAFGPKDFCRSRLAQVAAAFWMEDEETVHIVCFRSVAQYVFDLLKASSAQGSEVGYQ